MKEMKKEILERCMECEEDLKSENIEWVGMIMADIVAEMYYNYNGEGEELDEIFMSIGWMNEDGETIPENAHRYLELMK